MIACVEKKNRLDTYLAESARLKRESVAQRTVRWKSLGRARRAKFSERTEGGKRDRERELLDL